MENENRYGKLVILEFTNKKSKSGHKIVICRCDCGTTCERDINNLKQRQTKSCGCLRRETAKKSAKILGEKFGRIVGQKYGGQGKLEFGMSAFNRLYASYKNNAKKNNVQFYLSKEEFKVLTSNNCFYCNNPPEKIYTCPRGNGFYIYNGIDKINCEKSYIKDNCVSCCWTCNLMKHKMSIEIFFDKIKMIYENHKGKQI